MQIFKQINKLQLYLKDKNHISLVPTMGGLHDGHCSLIKTAQQQVTTVVVTIFVNPAQFGNNEDFDNYPADLTTDLPKLKALNVDCVFTPSVAEMYPSTYQFKYSIGYLNSILCVHSRPHFFSGVAKAVYRLFTIIKPQIAIFGEKDYQQFLIIKQMVADFKLPIQIINTSIVRCQNGLAMSTRNKYLTKKQLNVASNIYRILQQAKQNIHQQTIVKIRTNIQQQLAQFFILDYCEIIDSKNLGKINKSTTEFIILVAVYLDNVRLIDNIKGGINV